MNGILPIQRIYSGQADEIVRICFRQLMYTGIVHDSHMRIGLSSGHRSFVNPCLPHFL